MENKEKEKIEELNSNETKKETLQKIEWKPKSFFIIFAILLVLIIILVVLIFAFSNKTSSNGGGSCDEGGGKTCPLHIVIIYLKTLGLML